jgi:hypothetical protein
MGAKADPERGDGLWPDRGGGNDDALLFPKMLFPLLLLSSLLFL